MLRVNFLVFFFVIKNVVVTLWPVDVVYVGGFLDRVWCHMGEMEEKASWSFFWRVGGSSWS